LQTGIPQAAGGAWATIQVYSEGIFWGLRLRDDGVSGVLSAGTFYSTLPLSLVPCWQRACMSALWVRYSVVLYSKRTPCGWTADETGPLAAQRERSKLEMRGIMTVIFPLGQVLLLSFHPLLLSRISQYG
jgi:hypothetical protein